jgi:hypothetical protein
MSKLVSFGTMGAVATTFFGEKMFEMLVRVLIPHTLPRSGSPLLRPNEAVV